MAPQRHLHSPLGTCECQFIWQKEILEDMIKLRILRQGDFPGLRGSALNTITYILMREVERNFMTQKRKWYAGRAERDLNMLTLQVGMVWLQVKECQQLAENKQRFFPTTPGQSMGSLDMGPVMLISDFWLLKSLPYASNHRWMKTLNLIFCGISKKVVLPGLIFSNWCKEYNTYNSWECFNSNEWSMFASTRETLQHHGKFEYKVLSDSLILE